MRTAAGKIATLAEAGPRLAAARRTGRRVALAVGRFDVLHVGHVRRLATARAEADALVVCVEGDAPPGRSGARAGPPLPAPDRALLVAALRCVDHVVALEDDDVGRALRALRPDVYCTWSGAPGGPAERDAVLSYGGRVAVVGEAQDDALLERLRR